MCSPRPSVSWRVLSSSHGLPTAACKCANAHCALALSFCAKRTFPPGSLSEVAAAASISLPPCAVFFLRPRYYSLREINRAQSVFAPTSQICVQSVKGHANFRPFLRGHVNYVLSLVYEACKTRTLCDCFFFPLYLANSLLAADLDCCIAESRRTFSKNGP